MTKENSEHQEMMERKMKRVLKRLRNSKVFRQKVQEDPIGSLQQAGMPAILIGPFLEKAGHPLLTDPNFAPRNEAELQAAFLASNFGISRDNVGIFCRMVRSDTYSIACPTGFTREVDAPDCDAVVFPEIFTRNNLTVSIDNARSSDLEQGDRAVFPDLFSRNELPGSVDDVHRGDLESEVGL